MKKKIFIMFLFVFLLFIILFNNKSYACSTDDLPEEIGGLLTGDDLTNFNNSKNYLLFKYTNSEKYSLLFKDSPFKCTIREFSSSLQHTFGYNFAFDDNNSCYIIAFTFSNGVYSLSSSSVRTSSISYVYNVVSSSIGNDFVNIISSNADFVNSETGEVYYKYVSSEPSPTPTPEPTPDPSSSPSPGEDTGDNEDEEVSLSVIHEDLGLICSFLIFFSLVIILIYVYKFFNMFFTI